jgi:hypothetical protein
MTTMTTRHGGGRALRSLAPSDAVAAQRHQRKTNKDNHFPRGATGAAMPWRHDMSSLIEDLARDRMREIQRDAESSRQIRRARDARRAAKAAISQR